MSVSDIQILDDDDLEINIKVKNEDYMFAILNDIDEEVLYEYLKDDFDASYQSGWEDALEWKRGHRPF